MLGGWKPLSISPKYGGCGAPASRMVGKARGPAYCEQSGADAAGGARGEGPVGRVQWEHRGTEVGGICGYSMH